MSKNNGSVARLPVGLAALCVSIIAILWTALFFDFDRSEKMAIKQADSAAANLAMAFRENVTRTVSAIDQLMISIIAENQSSGDNYHIPAWVKDSPLLSGISVQVSISGPDGIMVASSLGSMGRVDISDRPHFRYHLDPSAPQPYISVPVIGRNSGKWSIQITRRITGKDGSFGGVVVVSVDPFYFSQFFESVDLGQGGVVDLIGRDGVVRARHARDSQEIGQNLSKMPLFRRIENSVSGTEITRSTLDGTTRIYAYSAVPGYLLVVVVGLAMDDVLAPAHHQLNLYLAAGTILTFVIITLCWFLSREVTRRRRRELAAHVDEKTREQRILLDTALNNMRHGLLIFDRDGRAVVVNQSYLEMYRLSPEAAKPGCTVRHLLEQRSANGTFAGDIDDYIKKQFAHVRVVDRITDIPDGRSIRVVNRLMDGGGWVATHEEVTQQRRAEAELKLREESVRMLFEANPVPLFVIDCDDLRFLAVNDAAVRHYGYSQEKFLAMTKLDIHPPQDRQNYIDVFRVFRESGDVEFDWNTIRRHRKSNGEDILVQVYGRRLNFYDRPSLLCSVIDVTERVRAEEERDRNREFLDSVIENVPVTIIVKDARTLQYILVNKAGENLWGISRDEIIGKTAHEVFDKKTADAIRERDLQLIASSPNLFLPEHKVETLRNGARFVTSNRIAIRNHKGEVQYLLGVIEDVTERKGVEDQLRQAQKMEAVGNLTGGVAHDFNNLLTIIMGNLDLLQDDIAGDPSAAEKIRVIMEATERGADLISHMLAFSRRQPLQAKAVDVNALIATITRLLDRTLGQDIIVDVRTAANLPAAAVDPSQLETALLNIAINARDAMPNGGILTIATRLAELDETYTARHPGVIPGTYVAIDITDNGIGIPSDVLQRIFEPFFTTKTVGKGTGLGLSMVYGFVKQSGGHINAYSEVGLGTVFKLFLPVASPAARPMEVEAATPRNPKPAGNEVILAVEDNPDIRATVVRQLRDLGYQVREADNADAALQILDAAEPIDLLLTDMIMPGGLNGKELATKARAKRVDLKVLFTSGFPGTSNRQAAQLEPGDFFLSKPYHKHDLAKAVEEVLSAPA